ncbi:MAG: FecR domain-containing protein [Balneolaceae bacterium]|nr:FecR domain-containing protein [Balneolaceae bacterium]
MGSNTYTVQELVNNISFIRWVQGTALPADSEQWDTWIAGSPGNREIARLAQNKILGLDCKIHSSRQTDREWLVLNNRIDSLSPRKCTPMHHQPDRSGYRLFRIAAVILVSVATGAASFFMYATSYSGPAADERQPVEWKTIETQFRQQKTVALSDGSTITLNANSSITYPAGWIRGNVSEVYLQGEAYFSISSRNKPDAVPFRVKTDDGTIEVMGTRFVVKTESDKTAVVLEEGAITIRKNGNNSSEDVDRTYALKPNERVYFSRDNKDISISTIKNTKIYTGWTQDQLVLDQSPFGYMIQRIKEVYGVDIAVNDRSLYQRTLTGVITLKDLDHVVRSISEVMDVPMSHTEETIQIGNNNIN